MHRSATTADTSRFDRDPVTSASTAATRWGVPEIIVLTLTDAENLRSIQRAKRQGAQILEIRIDRFRRLDTDSVLKRVCSLRSLRLPLIATIRSPKEGGQRFLSDSLRLEIFKKVLPFVEAVDLELSSTRLRKTLVSLARRKGKRVILSYHNFHSIPSDRTMNALLRKARRAGADLTKIAVTPKTTSDVARLLLFTHRNRHQNLISIGMGPHGVSTRVLAPLFGSLLTYGFVSRSQAPGQLSIRRLWEEMKAFGSERIGSLWMSKKN